MRSRESQSRRLVFFWILIQCLQDCRIIAAWIIPATTTRTTTTTPTTLSQRQQPPKIHRKKHDLKMTAAAAVAAAAASYDLIVIGGGSAGLTAAKFAATTLKKKTLLIENQLLGGDCTWTGCVPSKSLLASAKAAQLVRKLAIDSSSLSSLVDWKEIQSRYRSIQQEIYDKDDSPQVLAEKQIDTIEGRATLLSSKTVNVEYKDQSTKIYEATQGIILCTGATPKPAESIIPGLSTVTFVTYEQVWDLPDLPQRLTVVGGGPIGCELSQAFARLGSKVTMIAPQLLPRGEPEVSELLQQVFDEEGITLVQSRVESFAKNTDGSHSAMTSSGETIVGDVVLVATGRVPNTVGLGLEPLGIAIDSSTGGIQVDAKLQTTCKGIYAAGDCTGDKQFTHYAGYQGAIAARNILLPLSDAGVLSDVPSTTFTSPEIATVGYTEAQARTELGDKVVGVSKMRLDEVDRALCEGQRDGMLKVLYHLRTGKILGATIMAPAAGELISEISVARAAGMPFDAMAKVMHPYPSYAMALQLMAANVYYEKTTRLLWLYNFLKQIGL